MTINRDCVRLPAEWEKQEAMWLAWPHNRDDWPGRLEAVEWDFSEVVRLLSEVLRVDILCTDESHSVRCMERLRKNGVRLESVRFHIVRTDRSWLRDSGPTAVFSGDRELSWLCWKFNAWANYDDFECDAEVADAISKLSGKKGIVPMGPDESSAVVLEGGAFDTDGEGTLIVTEECLLSDVQCRNSGFRREDYEYVFGRYMGIEKTLWLKGGICGDDTHGHIDDVARFVAPGKVLLSMERDEHDANYPISCENLHVLHSCVDARGRRIKVAYLPLPKPVIFEGERLPASYSNFIISNGVVLVPTFNDERDEEALRVIRELFPERRVCGVYSRNFVLGRGTLHCLSQHQPART